MKDFDEARKEREEADRSFRIGGETFVYRPSVAPESLLTWSEFAVIGDKEVADVRAAAAALAGVRTQTPPDDATDEVKNRHAAKLAEFEERLAEKQQTLAAVTKSEKDWLQIIDESVVAMLEPDYHDTWRKVRDANAPHPLSLGDLQGLLEWLIGQVTGRPTGGPSGSSTPPAPTGTSSTDVSSSPEEPAPAA